MKKYILPALAVLCSAAAVIVVAAVPGGSGKSIADRGPGDGTGQGSGYVEYDDNGDVAVMGDTYYLLTAKNFSVNQTVVRNVSKLAATSNINNGIDSNDLIESVRKLESDVTMFRSASADKFLQCIYADVTVDAQEAQVFTENFKNINTQIQRQRDSVMGVDEDEEALDLVKFQNAYNLCSKIISVMAEMYDQLILRTGA